MRFARLQGKTHSLYEFIKLTYFGGRSMKMKAAVMHEINKPMVVEDVEVMSPGLDGVLVKVVAASVCHTDYSAWTGHLPYPMPIVLGHEGAGIVEEVGPAVRSVKKGDKVVLCTAGSCGYCSYCWSGQATLCQNARNARNAGSLLDGKRYLRDKNGKEINQFFMISCFAEYAVVPERTAIKVSDDADLKRACLFGCGSSTGVGAALNIGKVKPGHTVAIWGMGGLGLAALLGAKLAGAGKIICISRDPKKLDLSMELGADVVVNSKKEDPVARCKQLTGGVGVDVSLEFAGNVDVIVQGVDACCAGGVTVVGGVPAMTDKINISWVPFLAQKVLTGGVIGGMVPGVDIPRYVDLMMQGKLPVDKMIKRTMGLDEVNKTMDLMRDGVEGRTVVIM